MNFVPIETRLKHSTACLLNGLMTSLLRHIMCHESATAAMSSAVGDGE